MSTFTALLPFFYAVIFSLSMFSLCIRIIRKKCMIGVLSLGILALICFFSVASFPERFFTIDAKTSTNWENEVRTTKTAILFGFGFVMEDSIMKPGLSNTALYKQAITNAGYMDTLHLIMQEGVMVAAQADSAACYPFIRDLIRMHPHSSDQYINTLIAAKYAILKMDSLKTKRAVVYAHEMQLARAVYDLQRIAAANPNWRDMEFIVPWINNIPFDPDSEHPQTRSPEKFFRREVILARPLEILWPLWCIKTP